MALAVSRYRPKSASLVPAMIQMIIEARIAPALFAQPEGDSRGHGAARPADADSFRRALWHTHSRRLWCGRVYRRSRRLDTGRPSAILGHKRGSVGRPRLDVHLKITSQDGSIELPPGQSGLLHIKCDRFGPDWFRTNDLASIDPDGFVYLQGRADDAINRGGFRSCRKKWLPCCGAIRAVRDAAVSASRMHGSDRYP